MSNVGEVKMVEREEPRFVQFNTGDVVDGVLTQIERVTVRDKPVVRYTVRKDDGFFVQFLGTHQINTKLRWEDRGHRISVACVGEDTMVKRGDNCMKVFKVLVSEKAVVNVPRAVASDGTEITDDDIPF